MESSSRKIPVLITVYAEIECYTQPQDNPKVLFKQLPIAVWCFL